MARVVIHEAQVLITANRLTGRHVRETINAIERRARARAATGEYTTGRLAASIRSTYRTQGWRIHGSVGSHLPYAKFPDTGTAPHVIRPRGAGYPLRFYWRKVGRVVTPWKVNHPGQRSKGWLTDPLIQEARKRGWKVIIHDG